MSKSISEKSILCLAPNQIVNTDLDKYASRLSTVVNWDYNTRLKTPLQKIFTKVASFYYINTYIKSGFKQTQSELIEHIKNINPDYILWISMNFELPPEFFDEMRSTGALIGAWFFDDEVRFDKFSCLYANHLDFIFTTDPESAQKYQAKGIYADHLLVYPAESMLRDPQVRFEHEISFIGRKFGDRGTIVEELLRRNLPVSAWGRGWANDYIPLEQMMEIYQKSKISLCFTKSYGTNTRPQFKDKIFDIIGCGSFLLCEYLPGIENFFIPDKEIVCFHDIDDLESKIRYYLQHQEERSKIAEAGMKKVRSRYTSEKTLCQAFSKLDNFRNHIQSIHSRQQFTEKETLPARKCAVDFHTEWSNVLIETRHPRQRIEEQIKEGLRYMPEDPVLNSRLRALKKSCDFERMLKKEQYSRSIANKFLDFTEHLEKIRDSLISIFENLALSEESDYALFGAGKHSIFLLKMNLLPYPPKCIIDENTEDKDLFSIPVIKPEKLCMFNVKHIIISSDCFEDKLYIKAKNMYGLSVKIWRIYTVTLSQS